MRQFTYQEKWKKLLTPEIVSYLTQIHEFKGEQTLFIEAKAESELAAPVVADQTGSISNELLCRIGARLPVIEK